eukprot:m.92023 g.92023  ORF g.92023 m.92023 type:complete len:403 (+) comp14926_c0_seq2:94-1302(+)
MHWHFWAGLLSLIHFGASEIYHVFNDYSASDPAKQLEHAIVWKSWVNAKQVAAQQGVKVHHVGVVQRSDQPSVSADQFFSGRALHDPTSATLYGRPAPLVGGTLSTAFALLPARALIILTNRDIGFFPDMYLTAINASSEPNFIGRSYTRLQVNNTDDFTSPDQLDEVFTAPKTEGHHGHDCFVFRANSVPACFLQDRLLMFGTPGWDWLLRRLLLRVNGTNGFEIKHGLSKPGHEYTFHVGISDLRWKKYITGASISNLLHVWGNFKHRPSFRRWDSPGITEGVEICNNTAYTNTYPVCELCRLASDLNLTTSNVNFTCNGTFFPDCARPDCDMAQTECYPPRRRRRPVRRAKPAPPPKLTTVLMRQLRHWVVHPVPILILLWFCLFYSRFKRLLLSSRRW